MSRLEQLQKFLTQDPNDSFTRYAIGLELASAEQVSEAIAAFEELRTRDAGYVPTYYQLAGCYKDDGDREKAEEVYKEGIRRARSANDLHAASELQAALDELDEE
jgi:tetratricopeptide (TPR) repeat protein